MAQPDANRYAFSALAFSLRSIQWVSQNRPNNNRTLLAGPDNSTHTGNMHLLAAIRGGSFYATVGYRTLGYSCVAQSLVWDRNHIFG